MGPVLWASTTLFRRRRRTVSSRRKMWWKRGWYVLRTRSEAWFHIIIS